MFVENLPSHHVRSIPVICSIPSIGHGGHPLPTFSTRLQTRYPTLRLSNHSKSILPGTGYPSLTHVHSSLRTMSVSDVATTSMENVLPANVRWHLRISGRWDTDEFKWFQVSKWRMTHMWLNRTEMIWRVYDTSLGGGMACLLQRGIPWCSGQQSEQHCDLQIHVVFWTSTRIDHMSPS